MSTSKAASMKQKQVSTGNSNGSTYPGSDIGVTTFNSYKDQPHATSLIGADFMRDIRCSIPQNLGCHNSLSTPCGFTIASIASSNNTSLAPPDSDVGMMLLGDTRDSNPQDFLASSLTPAGSNSLERVVNITDDLSLPQMDVHMDLLGGTSGSDNQIFVTLMPRLLHQVLKLG
ncbi:hypothetical protein DH2020_030102 [Rehmannia glutinosa]|uniref:Uncharacterized protein n=1 Tax=Rehmannia glutinosa TaxID=99300 RepID=A0ABR0VLW5_REHGL